MLFIGSWGWHDGERGRGDGWKMDLHGRRGIYDYEFLAGD